MSEPPASSSATSELAALSASSCGPTASSSFFVRACRVVGTVVRAALVLVGVAHLCAFPPGDPVNVALVVEEVVPGKVAGAIRVGRAIQGLAVPQFGAAGGIGRSFGGRAVSTGDGR